ncbi:MAG: TrbG/VirB9 family P-type conjugative transfer protein [Proteobacteria bacterium]|nr:TrbG/VirB9 family P-type conjugative transfer protein [Pseudomonadota bacterium]
MKRSLMLATALMLAASPAVADGREREVHHREAEAPLQSLAAANDASRQRPARAVFQGARLVYSFQSGALYELDANPNYVSTILLEPGETLNTIAAGDTSRWMVTEAEGDAQIDGRTIVLVKPQATGLRTNIVLITDRRMYLVEAVSQTGNIYSAEIAWSYPIAPQAAPPNPVDALNFNYRVRTIRGRAPDWAPARVFDDGRRTWIEFAVYVAASDMPPLFIVTEEGAELVNYRVQGQRYMVDRIFDIGELRLGARAPTVVRIERNPLARPPARPMRLRSHP